MKDKKLIYYICGVTVLLLIVAILIILFSKANSNDVDNINRDNDIKNSNHCSARKATANQPEAVRARELLNGSLNFTAVEENLLAATFSDFQHGSSPFNKKTVLFLYCRAFFKKHTTSAGNLNT